MALRFDQNVQRFRDARGRFVTRTRGLKSASARRQYRAVKAPPPRAPPDAGPFGPGFLDFPIGAQPGVNEDFDEHAFDPDVFDEFDIDAEADDAYSVDQN